eukprot:4959000-Prymnesium_polylepis.3
MRSAALPRRATNQIPWGAGRWLRFSSAMRVRTAAGGRGGGSGMSVLDNSLAYQPCPNRIRIFDISPDCVASVVFTLQVPLPDPKRLAPSIMETRSRNPESRTSRGRAAGAAPVSRRRGPALGGGGCRNF